MHITSGVVKFGVTVVWDTCTFGPCGKQWRSESLSCLCRRPSQLHYYYYYHYYAEDSEPRQWGVNNLPKVAAQQCCCRDSNLRPCSSVLQSCDHRRNHHWDRSYEKATGQIVDEFNSECTDSQLNAEHWFSRIQKLYNRNRYFLCVSCLHKLFM